MIQGFSNWKGGVGFYPIQIINDTVNFQQVGKIQMVQLDIKISESAAYDTMIAWLNPPNSANKVYTINNPKSLTN